MKKILTILLSASILVSCSDDFTEIDPIGSLSDAALQNATGVDLLLTGAYSVLDGIRNGGPGADWTKSGDTGGLMLFQMMLTKDQLMVTKLTYLQSNFLHGIQQTHILKEDGKLYSPVLTEQMQLLI